MNEDIVVKFKQTQMFSFYTFCVCVKVKRGNFHNFISGKQIGRYVFTTRALDIRLDVLNCKFLKVNLTSLSSLAARFLLDGEEPRLLFSFWSVECAQNLSKFIPLVSLLLIPLDWSLQLPPHQSTSVTL